MADRDSLEDRVPCSDEMCVGIIGTNGRCGTCGKPGTPPRSGRIEHPHDDLHEAPEPGPDTQPEPAPETEPSAARADSTTDADSDPGDLSDRIPCPDDMCVGILSAKRRCGTCGREWPGA